MLRQREVPQNSVYIFYTYTSKKYIRDVTFYSGGYCIRKIKLRYNKRGTPFLCYITLLKKEEKIMKTKKVIVGAMAAMLSLSVCSLAPVVAAGETVQISVSKVNAEAGKQFSVDVSLADIPSSGIQALDFAVAYDSSVLTIDSVEAGALVTKGASSADLTSSLLPLFEGSINSKEGYVSLMWSTAADSSYWLNGSGVFCTISGTVSSSAKQGTVSELKIVPIDRPTYSDSDSTNAEIGCGYESNGKPVKVATKLVNGSVTVGTSWSEWYR